MKIGEFSAKYNIAPSKVRYYIHYGLLVPSVRNGQYQFNEDCLRDMDYIMELQQMQFPLNEILALITMRRKFTVLQGKDWQNLIHILEKQKKYLSEQIDKTYDQENTLNRLIEELTPIDQ